MDGVRSGATLCSGSSPRRPMLGSPAVFGGMMSAAFALLVGASASAIDFEINDEITGSVITSLSTGFQMRLADRDSRNVATFNGGSFDIAGNDDGNLNFDKYDIVSQISTITSELSLKYRDWFLYVRGTVFYDFIADRNDLAKNGPSERFYRGELPPGGQQRARYDAKFLDYYIGKNFQLFGRSGSVKLGAQVLNWGEALFTVNAISIINPIDVSRIRVPGAELRDALIPVPMISANYDLADNLSVEGFIQFDFEPYKLDACGSYFSFTDNFCDGVRGSSTFVDYKDSRGYTTGQGLNPDDYNDPSSVNLGTNGPVHVKDDPSTHDFGLALRYFSPELNNTEFQFYYVNYTSRLPSLYGQGPDQAAPGTGQLNLAFLPQGLLGGLLSTLPVEQLNAIGSALNLAANSPVGDIIGALTAPGTSALVGPYGTFPRSQVLRNLENGTLFLYYPKNINMLGFAFNTTEEHTGIAINAELSFKHRVPVWISEPAFTATVYSNAGGVPIDQAARARINTGLPAGVGGLLPTVSSPGIAPYLNAPGTSTDTSFPPRNIVRLDERHDLWVAAVRGTKIFGGSDTITRWLHANEFYALVELGTIYIDIDKDVQYAAYGQNGYSGFQTNPLTIGGVTLLNPIRAVDLQPPFPETWKAPTQWSGGLQGLFFWSYPDVFSGVTLTPSIGFAWGLFGQTPAPNPGFTKSVQSVNLALKGEYLGNTSVTVNYFKSWGGGGGPGGARNPYIDRDFVGMTVQYQF